MDFRIVWTASARCTAPAGRDKTTGARGCQCLLKPLEIAKSIGYRHFSRFFRNRSVHPMKLIDEIVANKAQLPAWRRDLHMHTETAFAEHRPAAFVAKALQSFAIPVHPGLAKTGVVGTLKSGKGNRAIAQRPDLDATHLLELNE